ncbi:TetR/AcrR family transcriptional regulator [Lichenihabitans sp. Uapishka_5]|uniref:TetR/AcrR family transcriptional regulator n=1 Tax=Lichenihabitans sp. Uapishka_5 TaxID=3037302 RepID=UPI0029E7DFB3|nr:TetR/AcrR family transcriptional regulator [Lichenihabitans sp. Uapishka_5]MDX7950712.1 TetR/AcrR family transcriptional regulator [Lichenihabitans sp. Uapishka_5]
MSDQRNETTDTSAIVNDDPAPVASAPRPSPRDAIIEALFELAAEREWKDISVSQIAERANLSLADFRDAFPSKGAVLGGFSRKIDQAVLRQNTNDLKDETPKERLFDVLMRRLDAMAPYRLGLQGVADWLRRDPVAAAAMNRPALNSMRFMLEASGINTEGQAGTLKTQGLVLAWSRVVSVWLRDEDPGLAATMAALDRELTRGETLASRVDDLERLATPLRLLAEGLMSVGKRARGGATEAGKGFDADVAPTP